MTTGTQPYRIIIQMLKWIFFFFFFFFFVSCVEPNSRDVIQIIEEKDLSTGEVQWRCQSHHWEHKKAQPHGQI